MRHSSRPGRVRLAAAATAGVLGATAALLGAAPAQGDPGSTVLYAVGQGGTGTVAQVDSVTGAVIPLTSGFYTDVTVLPGGDLLLVDFFEGFRYDPVTDTLTALGTNGFPLNSLATGPDGTVYALASGRSEIFQVSVGATDFAVTQVGTLPNGATSSGDLLVPDSGVYATVLTPDGSEDELVRMDDATGANPVVIGASGPFTYGLAQTSVGEFATQPGGDLVRIDLTTGAKSDPVPLGIGEINGLADPVTPSPDAVVPEVPVAALLPLAAVAVGAAMLRRRRTA